MKSTDTSNKGWAIWFTGLPGSGKSEISKLVYQMLSKNGVKCERLELDYIRKQYVANPEYTVKERDFVYEKLADFAFERVQNKMNIIIDATAHKLLYRKRVRKKIRRFVEVLVRCPLSTCIERESKRKGGMVAAQMYLRALERKEKGTRFKDLGKVIGVDVPYEENPDAEIIIDNSKSSSFENAQIVMEALDKHLSKGV